MDYLRYTVRQFRTNHILLASLASLVSLLAICLFASDALARPGGGGNYSGGGGGGGSGGGGGEGIGALIYLIVVYPEIGIPVAIVVGIVAIVKRVRNPDRLTSKAVANLEVSAAPSLGALGGIKQRDAGFNEQRFLDRVKGMMGALNEAWCRGDMTPVRTRLSDGLMRRFETQLAIMKHQGIRNAMADFEVLNIGIHAAEQDKHFDTLHVLLNAKARDVEVDAKLSYEEALGKAKKAPSESYSEIWSFLRKPGAQTTQHGDSIEGNCPSCGATLNVGQTTRCDHCQAVVNSGEYDWVLAEITQPVEWRPQSTGNVPGLGQLSSVDPGFNRQAAEDRASYLYWRWVEALVLGDARPLSKVATSEFRARITEQVKGGKADHYKTAVGAVDLVACEVGPEGGRDRYHVKVFWSSARSQKAQPMPMVNLLSLSRRSGARDTGGLSYARCRECMGALTENDSPTCDYCGTDLSAGETDWVLEDVRHPEDLVLAPQAAVVTSDVEATFAAPDMGNPRERVLLLMRMAAVVVADGVVTKEERKLINTAAKRWKVPMDAVEPILSGNIDMDVAMTMRPSNPKAFVSGLVEAALIDGKIDKKEEKLLFDVGQSLGLAQQQVKNLMEKKPG